MQLFPTLDIHRRQNVTLIVAVHLHLQQELRASAADGGAAQPAAEQQARHAGASPAVRANTIRQQDERPELLRLPAAVAEYLGGLGLGAEALLDEVELVPGGVLAAHLRHLPAAVARLQVVRASGSFFGHSWFDRVCVRVYESGEVEPAEGFAEVRAFVRAVIGSSARSLVYLRWFEEVAVSEGDVLAQFGAKPLKWAERVPSSGWRRQAEPWFQLVDLDDVVRREYIVQDYQGGEGRFHVSPFKW